MTGETFDELVAKIVQFRLKNGRPTGTPSMDVLLQYAVHSPWMVIDDLKPEKPATDTESYLAWRKSITSLWFSRAHASLTRKEAGDRLDTCSLCPMNKKKDWPETPESIEMEKRAFLLRAGQEVPSGTGFCGCHKFDIGIASFINEPAKYSEKPTGTAQPKLCWVI